MSGGAFSDKATVLKHHVRSLFCVLQSIVLETQRLGLGEAGRRTYQHAGYSRSCREQQHAIDSASLLLGRNAGRCLHKQNLGDLIVEMT